MKVLVVGLRVAAFGLTAVQGFLVGQQLWLRPVGGMSLVYLGVLTFRAAPEAGVAGRMAAYLSTLVLTLTNPATPLSFAFNFAGFPRPQNGQKREKPHAITCISGVYS